MADAERLICKSEALVDSGDGVRFDVDYGKGRESAFVVRFMGEARAYLNRCTHIPYELDWTPGKFFDNDGLTLVCSVHGATYEPGSGKCLGGPCYQGGLTPVGVTEEGEGVFLSDVNCKLWKD
jgi:nitrite reductase/ring-hydroxylating ferredoxin subunit